MRVLVVDESPAVRERLAERLREGGHQVIGHGDTAAVALELTVALAPEAVVLEILLPDRSGVSVVAALRAAAPAMVIGIVTNAPQYGRYCLAAGADFVLDKSSEFDEVAARLMTQG